MKRPLNQKEKPHSASIRHRMSRQFWTACFCCCFPTKSKRVVTRPKSRTARSVFVFFLSANWSDINTVLRLSTEFVSCSLCWLHIHKPPWTGIKCGFYLCMSLKAGQSEPKKFQDNCLNLPWPVDTCRYCPAQSNGVLIKLHLIKGCSCSAPHCLILIQYVSPWVSGFGKANNSL